MEPSNQLESLFQDAKILHLRKGEKLHNPMEKCKSLGFVKMGRLGLSRVLSSGKEILINDFCPGDLYAELMVLSGETYPGWITALEDSTVMELDLPRLLQLLQDSDILSFFFSSISHKVISLTNTIEILSQKTVKQKISYYLISISPGTVCENVSSLATRLGCSREALSRVLSELEHDHIISRDGNLIRVLDETLIEHILFEDH